MFSGFKVKGILKKHESERTDDEIVMLHQLKDVVKTAKKNEKQQKARKERILEVNVHHHHFLCSTVIYF